jgi:threonylcarbamoyladenosine tRNA methylthiotransferase MtaB
VSVEVVSLGCRLNLAESERLRGLLAGGAVGEDLVVVNSCSVTAEALRQTRAAIRRARRARPDARLLVTGCAAETDRAELIAMDEIDGLVANADKLDARAWNLPASTARPSPFTHHTRAFVAVQTGCDHTCTFCVIPQGRGSSRSRLIGEVVDEIAALVDAGVAEVVLTGVDLTSWGHDLADAPQLGDLVGAVLAACPALPRLRLSSLDGAEIDDALFELLAHEPRLMPHVHLSLQHGHDLILKRMKRRHSRGQAEQLVARLRARRPEIAIGADVIAGFPTEDDTAHEANMAMIDNLGIVHGHIFPFSARATTPAARMPQVSAPVIRARAAQLREAVSRVRDAWLSSHLHQPLEVLAERDGTGHAPDFARVRVAPGTPAGAIVTVTPTRIESGLLA